MPAPAPTRGPRRPLGRIVFLGLVVCLAWPTGVVAQRALHWERLDVNARLQDDGVLDVVETQALVLSGDWNGGERVFDIRPRQRLSVVGVERATDDGWRALTLDSRLDDIDDYALVDGHTLRWRSRRPADPPFSGTTIRYRLHYQLSGILQRDGNLYRLDHDFAFPDRDGVIERFELHLTFDGAWEPQSAVPPVHSAGPLVPGRSFVLEVPLRFTGAGTPLARDDRRPREIQLGVAVILGFAAMAVVWFFVRESRLGRFAPLATEIDEAWLRQHILVHPAEVVAAAWDDRIGSAEVVALIARMVDDGILQSAVGKGKGATAAMTLRLLVDRDTLRGHERVLVDKLFVNGRTETSTRVVQAHYRKTGFRPSTEIEPELTAAVEAMLPAGQAPRRARWVALALLALGVLLVARAGFEGFPFALAVWGPIGALTLVGWGLGARFRGYLHWGAREAWLCLTPALSIAVAAAAYLWFVAGTGRVELSALTVAGLVAVTLAGIHSATSALASRRHREALAFRKTLTAARAYFIEQLHRDQPALRDAWYPWLLAFELTPQMDAWTTARAEPRARTRRGGSHDTVSASDTASSAGSWTGFGGGRSGGAGGGAAWQAAASGMAAGVAAPSSSGSSGGSSSGSSGGGSSGGGGGGGW